MTWFSQFIESDPVSFLAYFMSFLAMGSLWISSEKKGWKLLTLLSLVFAFLEGRIFPIGILAIIVFLFLVKTLPKQEGAVKILIEILIALGAIAFIRHKLPGFFNWEIVHQIRINAQSTPYSFFWNFDSLLCGSILLAYFADLARNRIQWQQSIKASAVVLAPMVFFMLLLAWLFGYVLFDPKIPYFFPAWVIENLLIVSLSQEVIYRGFILERLTNYFPSKIGVAFSLALSSILFAYIHTGPFIYLIFCFVSGLFYGWAFLYYRRIESAIVVHFLFNLTHLLLFSYPALQK